MATMFCLFLQDLRFLYPFFIPFLVIVIFTYRSLCTSLLNRKNPPPSLPRLPIIGNLHQVGLVPHRSLQSLSRRCGKLMLLHFGSKPTLVVSSADAAREIMKTHDVIFSNRPKSRNASRIFYDCKDVAFGAYGEQWRQMKSFCVMQLLSNKKVQSFRQIREEEAILLIEKIRKSHSSEVNLSKIIIGFTNDVICRAAFGRKYSSSNGEGGIDFGQLLNEAMELLMVFSFGEFIPWLSWIDWVKGLDGRVAKVAEDLDDFLEKVVQEHQCRILAKENFNAESDKGKNVKNFVDILLEFQRENKDGLHTDCIKAVILNMFAAGTDTVYSLIEWAMSELIRHPRVMKEVQQEVRSVVRDKALRVLCEDDLEKLTYLKAVMKEALRLHPPAPLLMFREASQNVIVNGFNIDAGTQVIINAWAIQRDPKCWEEPDKFIPERFLKSTTSIDYKGHDFQYIPFGGGRRMCPGIAFAMVNAELVIANVMVNAELVIANVVCEFDWKLPGGVEGGKLDMAETSGISVHKKIPLMVLADPYSCI